MDRKKMRRYPPIIVSVAVAILFSTAAFAAIGSSAEAEGEGTKGKALVMLVVLNRVWSDEFPDTVEEVIFQKNQFSVTMPGGRYYTTEPDEECMEALHLVNTGWDESYGALYFESCEGDSWHSRNLEFLFQAGNHKFYR